MLLTKVVKRSVMTGYFEQKTDRVKGGIRQEGQCRGDLGREDSSSH